MCKRKCRIAAGGAPQVGSLASLGVCATSCLHWWSDWRRRRGLHARQGLQHVLQPGRRFVLQGLERLAYQIVSDFEAERAIALHLPLTGQLIGRTVFSVLGI